MAQRDEREETERPGGRPHDEPGRSRFDEFAERASRLMGRGLFFAACLILVGAWLASFFLFRSLEHWQAAIQTVTAIVTFLMVALLENSQRRSERAVNHKLNAIAEAQADLMRAHQGDEADLSDDIEELRRAVGIEERVGMRGD